MQLIATAKSLCSDRATSNLPPSSEPLVYFRAILSRLDSFLISLPSMAITCIDPTHGGSARAGLAITCPSRVVPSRSIAQLTSSGTLASFR